MKYRVTAYVTMSLLTVVDAENEEEAKTIAGRRPMCSLGRLDRDAEDEAWCHSGEIDGEPVIQYVEVS